MDEIMSIRYLLLHRTANLQSNELVGAICLILVAYV